MSRNGSGIYSKAVTSFSSGGVITAADHNNLWDDLVSEVTNSVAADGQTTITGPIKFAAGSSSAPSLTFASDTDTGLYRSSANQVSIVASASQVAIFAASAAQINVPTLFISTVGITGELTLSATANFSLGFISSATAVFQAGIAVSGTAVFSHPVLMSGTATFTNGFLASNTCSFSHPILVSGTATFTKGFLASATCTLSGTNPVVANNTPFAYGFVTWSAGTPTLAKGYNCSVSDPGGAGRVLISFTNNAASTNYAVLTNCDVSTRNSVANVVAATRAVSGFQLSMQEFVDTSTGWSATDINFSFVIMGGN